MSVCVFIWACTRVTLMLDLDGSISFSFYLFKFLLLVSIFIVLDVLQLINVMSQSNTVYHTQGYNVRPLTALVHQMTCHKEKDHPVSSIWLVIQKDYWWEQGRIYTKYIYTSISLYQYIRPWWEQLIYLLNILLTLTVKKQLK